ncbi:hypothetical protein DVH24_014613 [Malus domestica]|uniref:Uncharacterized protein n=1 Tax=Malus domestica TaxID=3750 RepID=A0A498KKP4_MALDO|nr:hypothetical protein DVH24_014613 [Malus domestica]
MDVVEASSSIVIPFSGQCHNRDAVIVSAIHNDNIREATSKMETNVTKRWTKGGPSECDNQYHNDNIPVVALSTGWFNNGGRCLNNITISANGGVWLLRSLMNATLQREVMQTMIN